MGPILQDDNLWTRRGISLLWNADALAKLCEPKQVVSLRRLLQLHELGWPEAELPLVNDETLVVAGLENSIDALPPEQASDWLENVVYQAIVSYQREVAGGGSEAALVFWIVDSDRLQYQTSDDMYYWQCGTEYKDQRIALSRCLFNGAHRDLCRIEIKTDRHPNHFIGLYHPRVS